MKTKMILEKVLNKDNSYQHSDSDKLQETNCKYVKKNCKSSLVSDLHPHDVIIGRGEGINKHFGNMLYRQLVAPRRSNFYTREQRKQVASDIINEIQKLDPPGRFLMISPVDCSSLYEISYKKTITKVCQSLRDQNAEKQQESYENNETRNDNVTSSETIKKRRVSSHQEVNKDLTQHAVTVFDGYDDSTKKQIIMPLSYIGSAFLETSDQCSEESKHMFRMLANISNQDESVLLRLPGIVGSLCKHIDDLERKNSTKL